MVAQRKQVENADSTRELPHHLPATVSGERAGAVNHALAAERLHLEAIFTPEKPEVSRYPGALRLAIILGGSTCLWAIAAGVVHILVKL